MRNKIEGLNEFKKLQESNDVTGLLRELKGFAYSPQGVCSMSIGQCRQHFFLMQAALRNWINL